MNRIFTVLLFFLILPIVALAQSGQFRGTITDQETGEPLIGANVLVVGTNQGAATDINGEYIILNLHADVYALRASYIGYQEKTIQNIRVVAGLTSEINFQLAAEGLEVGEVVVIAQRPLINKYNTNANRITTSDDIKALPVRGVDEILALIPGVVLQDGAIFVRGGRQDEVGFYLEGVNITDPMVGGRGVTLNSVALEEIQVQSGGYTAEFGGANSGIIKQQIKTGTPDWRFSAEYITDNIGFNSSEDRFSGEKTLGTFWYGYDETIVTLSGPIFSPNVKFFGLFNYNYITDQNAQPFPGFDLGRIGDPSTGDTLDFFYPAGAVFNNSLKNYNGTASLTFNLNPLILRLVGTYNTGDSWNPFAATRQLTNISNFLNTARTEKVESEDGALNLKATYLINANTFAEVNVGFSFNNLDRFDPFLKDDFLSYGDSVANANVGWVWDRSRDPLDQQAQSRRYQKPTRHNIFTFTFYDRGAVVAGFQKFNRQNLNGSLSFTSQINKNHNIKFGGEYQYFDIANFSFNNERVTLLAGKINNDANSSDPLGRETVIRREGVNNFGYNPLGEKTNDGIPEYEQARNPNFLGIYVQDRIEYNDLIINVGVRYDRIDIDNWVPIDKTDPDS